MYVLVCICIHLVAERAPSRLLSFTSPPTFGRRTCAVSTTLVYFAWPVWGCGGVHCLGVEFAFLSLTGLSTGGQAMLGHWSQHHIRL